MSIVSSNRTRAEWDEYLTPDVEHVRLVDLVTATPHQPVEFIARHAIAPSPLRHVIDVDECGAPILDPTKHHLVRCENG
jgi:hypothetical protein